MKCCRVDRALFLSLWNFLSRLHQHLLSSLDMYLVVIERLGRVLNERCVVKEVKARSADRSAD